MWGFLTTWAEMLTAGLKLVLSAKKMQGIREASLPLTTKAY